MVTSMMLHPPGLAPSSVHYHLHLMKSNYCFVLVLPTSFILCILSNDRVVGSNSEQSIVSQPDEVYVCTYFELKVLKCFVCTVVKHTICCMYDQLSV